MRHFLSSSTDLANSHAIIAHLIFPRDSQPLIELILRESHMSSLLYLHTVLSRIKM